MGLFDQNLWGWHTGTPATGATGTPEKTWNMGETPDMATLIKDTAGALGVDPLELATIISYETGGTMDPMQAGPTTKWGQHRGLIQFGEPQAAQFGVDFSNPNAALGSQLGANGAIVKYALAHGFKPGMSALDLYSTINAGAPGRYGARDAAAGGAPGTVADKFGAQMDPHRAKAAALLGGEWNGPTGGKSAGGADVVSTKGSGGLMGFLGGGKNAGGHVINAPWLTDDRRDRLIMALQSMTMNPNQAMIAAASDRIRDRAATNRDTAQRNKTAEWLAANGRDDLAQAVMSGAVDGRTAASIAMTPAEAASPNVQSSQMLPDNSGVITIFRDGNVQVKTVGGDVLTGQEAVDFAKTAQENYTQQQRDIYYSRNEGSNLADRDTGGAAKAAESLGSKQADMVSNAFEQADAVATSLNNINSAIEAIDAGAKSGIVYNMMPNITKESASLQNAMDRMGLDVIGSVTFGALNESELRLAMETAVPRNLAPPDLRAWLVEKRNAQQKVRVALMEQARFLSNPDNNLQMWAEMVAGKSSGQSAGGAAPVQPGAPSGPQPGVTEDGYKFLGGDPADPNNWEKVQ